MATPAASDIAQVPVGGWLRAVRQQHGYSQQQLASKLAFKRQAWAQLEASEARGAISLYSLRRAADAMGYDFVYFLAPRTGEAAQSATVQSDCAEAETADLREVGGSWNAATELPTELR